VYGFDGLLPHPKRSEKVLILCKFLVTKAHSLVLKFIDSLNMYVKREREKNFNEFVVLYYQIKTKTYKPDKDSNQYPYFIT
jgi:hypothetical protein